MAEENKPLAGGKPDDDKLWSVLAYIGILVLLPLVAKRDSATVKYHTKQGLVLFVVEVILSVIAPLLIAVTLGLGALLFPVLWLIMIILSIVGIMNALNNRQQPLPLIGQWADKFSI